MSQRKPGNNACCQPFDYGSYPSFSESDEGTRSSYHRRRPKPHRLARRQILLPPRISSASMRNARGRARQDAANNVLQPTGRLLVSSPCQPLAHVRHCHRQAASCRVNRFGSRWPLLPAPSCLRLMCFTAASPTSPSLRERRRTETRGWAEFRGWSCRSFCNV